MDPEEALALLEAAYSQDERAAMAKRHEALPDGSFPIATKADLEHAIRAFGRAKDQAAAKQHIITRARALGALDLLPADWNVQESEPATSDPPAAVVLPDGALLESADNGQGWKWRVQIIQAGVSKNRTEYPLAVLHKAAPLYEGVPVFYGRKDHGADERGFDSQAGYIRDPKPNSRGVEGTFEIRRDKADVRAAVLHGWETYQQTGRLTFGFSHMVPAGKFTSSVRRLAEGLVRRIERYDQVDSVDLVSRPSAGGELLGLVAGVNPAQERSLRAMNELLERLRRGEALTEAQITQLREEAADELRIAEAEGRAARAAAAAEESARKLEEAAKKAECRDLLSAKLAAASTLPAPLREAITADFAGRVFEAEALDARITRDTEIAAKLVAVLPKSGGLTVTEAESDKWGKALDGFWSGADVEGVTRFRTLKEAFRVISGTGMDSLDSRLPFAILAEARLPQPGALRESVTTNTFDQLFGDSITRRMIQQYNMPQFTSWRQIASNIVPISDFRSNRRMRFGGYGDLPSVGQGAPYQPLTSPTDEEATYSIAKYGGTEDLTMEAIANDDVGSIRQIPAKLGRAAASTLYHSIWNTIIRDNATCTYDSTALYDASHGNTGTSALAAAALLAAENAMRDQTAYDESGRALGAGNMPKILVIPNELRDTAFRLVGSGVAVGAGTYSAEPNIFQGAGYTIIVVDDWTDANNWFLFADPQNTPILEVGFFGGREEPELFTQDQPNIGSTFTADKVTYKIRHIWGVGILDHRGTYRQVV